MKHYSLVLIFAYFFMAPLSVKAVEHTDKDLSLVVLSCDKYSELWDNFFKLLYRQWPALETSKKNLPIYLLANAKKYPNSRVQMINIENEKSWSDNLLEALEHIHTPYVLVLLEDYYLTDFNEERFYALFNYMKQAKSAYMQIWGDYKGPKDREGGEVFPGVAVKNKNEEWRTSLQACIWRVEDLRHLLKKGENPWEFERAGSIRSEGSKEKFLIVYKESPVNYLNMTQLGYVNGDNLRALQTMGIEFKPQTLKIDDDHKLKLWFKRQFIHDVYWNVVEPVIRGVTGFLKGL